MKNLPKILLVTLSILGILGLLWVILDYNTEADQNVLIAKGSTSFMIWLAFLTTIVTVVLFIIFKVRDILIHPSHLKEVLIVIGIVAVSLVFGFIFGGSEDIITGDGHRLTSVQSRLIGSGLVASILLLVISIGFLAFDAVKATLK